MISLFNIFRRDPQEVERERREQYTVKERNGKLYIVAYDGCGGTLPVEEFGDDDCVEDIIHILNSKRDMAVKYHNNDR